MQGYDISVDQGAIDFAALQDCGFIFAKATEGVTYADANYREYHDGAKAHGIPFGAYHFLRFADDPVDQAEHFIETIDGYQGTLLPFVDVESGGQDHVTDPRLLIGTLSIFLQRVERSLGGKRCIIYTDYGDWNGFMQGSNAFSGHPLFVAEYNHDIAPTLPNGWHDWVIWQHSDGVGLTLPAGFTANVDRDTLNPAKTLEDISR